MAATDRERWDDRYANASSPGDPVLPGHFRSEQQRLVNAATAIDVACGGGRASVWLALQGVHVTGYDISPVAIALATKLAEAHGVSDRCTFEVADFDTGLSAGPQVDLVLCNMFRNARLDGPIIERLNDGGTVAIACLSEVGAEPGRFRATPGELVAAYSRMKPVAHGEGDGIAWLVAVDPT